MSVDPSINIKQYLAATNNKIGDLHVEKLIPTMSEKERNYATFLILASWAGYPILLDQVSKESPRIHKYLSALFKALPRDSLNKAITVNIEDKNHDVKDANLKYLIEYAALFYYNGGNYLGFGDTKFIPRVPKESLREITPSNLHNLLDDCIEDIYSLEKGKLELGFSPEGVTTYYDPSDITKEEVESVNQVIAGKGLKIENTKIVRDDLKNRYNVLLPSVQVDDKGEQIGEVSVKLAQGQVNWPVFLTKGRYSDTLKKVNFFLNKAKEYASNETEQKMLSSLISSYETGSCADHVKYSEYWVKDVDPPVEFYHGFIESYRDPSGIRAEFEGFVACIDPKESRILHKFVESSQVVLPLLPLLPEYERKTFTPPSYNAINILTFVTSGFPIGINIPNYDEIRDHIGFKNVSLTNVINASATTKDALYFLDDSDADIVIKFFSEADNMATAAHELYGHGSGKLLRKSDVTGPNKVRDLLNKDQFVTTYYEEGQTAEQTFGGLYSAFEECRAETSSLYLSFFEEVLDIFEIKKDPEYRRSLQISGILGMLHAGMKTLNCYSVEAKQWRQAHAAARFAIVKACLKWGNGSVSVVKAEPGFRLVLDKSKLDGVKEAVTKLLVYLNYYKSTNKAEEGKAFFNELTSVDDFFLEVRKYIMTKERSRYLYVGAKVQLVDKASQKYNLTSQVEEGRKADILDVLYSYIENIEVSAQ